jgi:hypothetical protein
MATRYPDDWSEKIRGVRTRLSLTQGECAKKSKGSFSLRSLQRAESKAGIDQCSVSTLRGIFELFVKEAEGQLKEAVTWAADRLGTEIPDQITRSTAGFETWKRAQEPRCAADYLDRFSETVHLKCDAEDLRHALLHRPQGEPESGLERGESLEPDDGPGVDMVPVQTQIGPRTGKVGRFRPLRPALLLAAAVLLLAASLFCRPAPVVTTAAIDDLHVSPSACPRPDPCPVRWESRLVLELDRAGSIGVYLQDHEDSYYLQAGTTYSGVRHAAGLLYPGTQRGTGGYVDFRLYVVTRRCLSVPRSTDYQQLTSLPRGRVFGPVHLRIAAGGGASPVAREPTAARRSEGHRSPT